MLAVGEFFVRARSACHIARRRRVLIRPKAERSMLAVGELFVWARSARSQARSACVIARRRRALPPRGTKTSTPTAEGRWGAANLSAKPKVRRPPQALVTKPLVYNKPVLLHAILFSSIRLKRNKVKGQHKKHLSILINIYICVTSNMIETLDASYTIVIGLK